MLRLSQIKKMASIDAVIVQSLDCALYQALVLHHGQEHVVCDEQGQPLRARSILSMQAHFDGITTAPMRLRHESAYDEMVGQPLRQGSNRMEVPLGNRDLAAR